MNSILNLHIYHNKDQKSPLKYAFILSLITLFEKNPKRENKFTINDELESNFLYFVKKLDPNYHSKPLIEYPFFHLQHDNIWHLKYKENCEEEVRNILNQSHRLTKSRIIKYVDYGYLSESIETFLRESKNRNTLMNQIFNDNDSLETVDYNDYEKIKLIPNHFVTYLNTLQSIQGNNTSALAEYQSMNDHFSLIEEKHPLSALIDQDLKDGHHVILTGHAGDGKSTIAIESYKKLVGLPEDKPLTKTLDPESFIPSQNITLIKDLSENRHSPELLDRIMTGSSTYLLITNTGALLTMFKDHPDGNAQTESDLLRRLQSARSEFTFRDVDFIIYNLACMNNLPLARRVLIRMLDEKNWRTCETCPSKGSCPMLSNRGLLVQDDFRAVDRIFLVYRRLLAYGTRLTMRQLMEHLAWTITGGNDCRTIQDTASSKHPSSTDPRCFHHLFFGDNGSSVIGKARSMKAVSALRNQAFGFALSPDTERVLWNGTSDIPQLGLPLALLSHIKVLKRKGINPKVGDGCQTPHLVASGARTTIRRMLFFHGNHAGTPKDIDAFLASPFTRRWAEWEASDTGPSDHDKKTLFKELIFVLKEQFSGQKSIDEDLNDLFITQHRDVPGLRQSAQLLTAKVHIETQLNTLQWETKTSLFESMPEHRLILYHTSSQPTGLPLDIAFLDYVNQYYRGTITDALSRAFKQRLDNFKNSITAIHASNDDPSISILCSLTDSTQKTFHCLLTNEHTMKVY